MRPKEPLAKRVFRSGAATGDILMEQKPGGGFDIAGTTIARAVRLEAKATPGGLLVDEETFAALSPDQQRLYGPKVRVSGKRNEVFDAFACQLNADGEKDVAFFTQPTAKEEKRQIPKPNRDARREIVKRFSDLKPDQYLTLIFLLNIPIGQRPAEVLSLDEKRDRILRWSDEDRKLDELLEILQELTEEGSRSPK